MKGKISERLRALLATTAGRTALRAALEEPRVHVGGVRCVRVADARCDVPSGHPPPSAAQVGR